MKKMTTSAWIFVVLMAIAGLSIQAYGFTHWVTDDALRFSCYLGIAVLASGLKVSLPSFPGTMSVNFLFILIGILELSFPETLVIASMATLVQCFWNQRKGKTSLLQFVFNVSNISIAVLVAYQVYHGGLSTLLHDSRPLLLVASASTYFIMNTVPVSAAIALTEKKSLRQIWSECYFWSFPYYLVGAGIAGVVSWIDSLIGWQTSLLVLPPMYLIYRSYRLYLGKLEAEKTHVEDMASLHLRTIEALALAIEAKDNTTHDHLQRVRVYALELARLVDLKADDMEALRAAALLHDIGKLAVPEHIISKPGRLTPEEFEKMKIHPLVGAEILERVQFPYPVVPIVRSHHEKWDGSGYPDGLKAEEIPIGARILSVVDCLDALASDRQYRRALPLDQAMEKVEAEAGKAFDPRLVEVLKQHYVELEKMAEAQMHALNRAKLNTDIKVERGGAPAAGFAASEPSLPAKPEQNFLTSIAAARHEAQMLFELSHELGTSLSIDETLSVVAVRLKRLVPYDSIAIYLRRDDELIPEYVSGDNFRLFSSLKIPMGQGLSGWVAQNRKAIINGNPSVEPGYLNDPSKFSTLRSAMAVPLEGIDGVMGVMALYSAERDAFTNDHLRILLAISSKITLSIDNALKYRQAESSATTDYMTGLPNARSLFLHLDRELARSKRTNDSLAVMVCDLDGFKQVNDRFGHLEGNKVLQLFANLLKDACREYDYVARMGGDEFVVVAPGLNADAISAKVILFNELARATGRQVCGEDLLAVSVGQAIFPEDGNDAEQLLAKADRSMYIMKQIHHAERPVTAKTEPIDIANLSKIID